MTMTSTSLRYAERIAPASFEAHQHWYPKALNATIHPLVNFFLSLDSERIIKRYCHLRPQVEAEVLRELLNKPTRHFLWAGADLINVTSTKGGRRPVVIENNSCPSGQKSMPLRDDLEEQGGYRLLMERTFKPYLKRRRTTVKGALAVVYDKNPMEASGYAESMADVFGEEVYYVPFYYNDPEPPVRFVEGVMEVRDEQGQWQPIRAAFRYLTQKPWNRLPVHTRTIIFNPIIACLAGGRNKMVAAKAYDFFNGKYRNAGLQIHTPKTIWDVHKAEIPLWVRKMGGQAVVKVPYSNAGQGVYTIVNEEELDRFMAEEHTYNRFIVQSLIGNANWSSMTEDGKLYHVGTIPNSKGNTFVADLRMMLSSTEQGLRPLSVYARRAQAPLVDDLEASSDSWDMLGTNLSIKEGDNAWTSDTNRLLLMDRRDFNKLGLGLDDLIEAYIQTVLSTLAIDEMASDLLSSKGTLRKTLFKSLNNDAVLLAELVGKEATL